MSMDTNALALSLKLLFEGRDAGEIKKALNVARAVPQTQRVKYVCQGCGGTDIVFAAEAAWNIETQEFEFLGVVEVRDWCNTCQENHYVDEVQHDWQPEPEQSEKDEKGAVSL